MPDPLGVRRRGDPARAASAAATPRRSSATRPTASGWSAASDPPRLSEHRKGGGGGRVAAGAGASCRPAGWRARSRPTRRSMIRTAPSGGMVFSVGTTDWPLALARSGGGPDHRERGRPAGAPGPAHPRAGLRRRASTSATARWSAPGSRRAGTSTAARPIARPRPAGVTGRSVGGERTAATRLGGALSPPGRQTATSG